MNQSELISVYSTATTMERVMERRKRRISEADSMSSSCSIERQKRPRYSRYPRVYLRLESESSADSTDDTESVYSIQGKETDVARDTTDTESQHGHSDSESVGELVTLEYDVASSSSDEFDGFPGDSSSGTEDANMQAAAEGTLAAVLLDSSMSSITGWDTDGETSEGSTIFDAFDLFDVRKEKDFGTCLLCKSQHNNPSFPYCEKCFQKCWQCKTTMTFKGFPLCLGCYKVRKTFFPPRPKPTRKRKHHDESNPAPVKLDTLQNCLDELKRNGNDLPGTSVDAPIPNMKFEDIVVPPSCLNSTRSHDVTAVAGEQSDEDIFDDDASTSAPPAKRCKIDAQSVSSSQDSGICTDKEVSQASQAQDESAEKCIVCTIAPKNGIFLHGAIAHMCCCYKCAIKVWKNCKRCPVCNCKVNNVVKLFTS